jgi:hypothetical protein
MLDTNDLTETLVFVTQVLSTNILFYINSAQLFYLTLVITSKKITIQQNSFINKTLFLKNVYTYYEVLFPSLFSAHMAP